MDTPAVAICALLGLAVGWFVVVRAAETIPEPLPLETRGRVAVAVVNAVLWGFVADKFIRWWVVAAYAVFFSALVAVSVVDLRLYRIPNRIVFPALGATFVLLGAAAVQLEALEQMRYAAVGALCYFGILFLFHMAYPRGMGFGDVKLAILMGLAIGWLASSYFGAFYLVLITLFFGSILGILFGIAARLIRGRGGAFPFGPALALAAIYVVMNFQQYLV